MGARVLLVTVAASLLAGCGSEQAGGSSGLSGTVILSPATPVCRVGASCSRPARGLTLLFVRNGHDTAVKTDRHGHYRIQLSPGAYRVRIPGARLRTSLKPRTATVRSGGFGNLDFRYDPGIR
ncbi:MAG: hypothetical protein ACXVRE_04020 [Gaiellaceae bacterium]